MVTMASRDAASVCFSCGQPLPSGLPAADQELPSGGFPLTGGMVSPLTPPPNPYEATGATLRGDSGHFTIAPSVEVRVGRDAAMCAVCLTEPRVSAVHATLKLEQSKLWVRDEHSNNGTFIADVAVAPGTWTEVGTGASLRFGPVAFSVRVG